MNVPANLKYSNDHEWCRVEGDTAVIGITDFAQSQLGDIVFVDVPTVGETLAAGEVFGSIEAVKTVSDAFLPIGGEILEFNDAVDADPAIVNKDAYVEGWLIKVRMTAPAEYDALLSAADYEKLITEVVGKRAKKRALHLLEQMDRSERKLREKLTQGGYPDCCVDAAIDYVKSFHYLDDYRFASTYVRYHQDSLSRRQLEQKLMTKGIGRDDINCAIDSEYTADEEKHIAKLLEKKHYDPDNCDEKEFRRIYQFLMRRGFKSSQILSAMRSQLP